MLSNFEALSALAEHGTMSRAAVHMHLTQSAISKRIQNLEFEFGQKLIERSGRRVLLTPFAVGVLERIRPLVTQLKEVVLEKQVETTGHISVTMSVSLLIAGGAQMLAKIKENLPEIDLAVSAQHASIAVENVRSGKTSLAIVQGKSEIAPDLSALPVMEQQIVIVPSGLKTFRFPKKGSIKVLGIETHTEAWRFMERGIKANRALWGVSIELQDTVESFSAITELARAGFGHGLVPYGVARALGIAKEKIVTIPKPGLAIPISLIGRQTTLARPLVQKLYDELLTAAKKQDNR